MEFLGCLLIEVFSLLGNERPAPWPASQVLFLCSGSTSGCLWGSFTVSSTESLEAAAALGLLLARQTQHTAQGGTSLEDTEGPGVTGSQVEIPAAKKASDISQ